MKQIYSVFTYYQLITAIQIKNKLFPEADADIVISDHSAGYEKAAEKVRESGIFDNVYTAKSVDAMRLDSFSKKLRRVVDIVFYNNKFSLNCSDIEKLGYDEILFFNFNYFDNCLYYLLKKNNPDLICRRFEESYTSGFDFDIFTSGSAKLQKKFERLHSSTLAMKVDEMFFYEPELVLFKNSCKISPIPKIDKNDLQTKDILNKMFDYTKSDEYDRKYIFFEESYNVDGKEMDDLELVLNIADKVGRENMMVKLHPRSKVDRFAEYGIKTNKTVGIPWEVIIMNNDFSDKVFMTIASGSVLSPRILFGENVATYMLFNCTKVKSSIVTDSFYKYLELFKKKYGASGFYIPDNFEELSGSL